MPNRPNPMSHQKPQFFLTYGFFQCVLVALFGQTTQVSQTLSNQSFSNVLYENSTSFIQVSNFVSLPENKNFRLTKTNTTASQGISIKYVDMYQEYSTIEFKNELLIDSFGFRLGGISGFPMQLILTQKRILVYNFTTRDISNPMSLILLSNTSLGDLFPGKNVTMMGIDGTTSAVQLQPDMSIIEFVISISSFGSASMLMPLQFECKEGFGPQSCKMKKKNKELDLKPMFFVNINNHSDSIPCNPSIASLDNIYNSSEINGIGGPSYLYFARFCKLSTLSPSDQALYSNLVEVYMLSSTLDPFINPIQLRTTISQISYSNQTYQTQVVDLIEFRGAVFVFNLNETYQIQPNQLGNVSIAINAFTNNGKMTNLVACQQNDYNVVSCYLSLYDPEKQQLNNYLTEFANVQDNVIRIPPIALSYVSSGETLGAINLNFIVFVSNELCADRTQPGSNSVSKMKIIQRGTDDILSNVTSINQIILMKPMGPNFIMYRNMDIGMIFKQNQNINGFNASVYTMQQPFFRVDVASTNKSLPCFNYISECQVVSFNLSYQPVGAEDDTHSSQLIDFYHLNQNYSSIIPVDLNSTTMEVDITRDQVLINVTDSFHGVPKLLQVTNREYSPTSVLGNYNATTFFSTFDDLRINITGLDQLLYDYSAKQISSAKPSVVRYTDGSIFISIGYILSLDEFDRIVVICQLPDSVDAGQDSDFTFSYNSLICASPETVAARPDVALFPIINYDIRRGVFYLLSFETGNEEFVYLQMFVSDNDVPRCKDYPLTDVRPIPLQKVRIIRSSSSNTYDDCLLFWNEEEFNIVALDFSTNPKNGTTITPNPLISINIKNLRSFSSWEWHFPNVSAIESVTIADFNVVYLIYRYSIPLGTVMQIHQCDFYSNTPKCFLYGWVPLDASVALQSNPIVIDRDTFNFVRFTQKYDLELVFYDLSGYKNDFMHTARKELKSAKKLNLKTILKSSFAEFLPIEDGIFIMNSVAGVLTIEADGRSPGCNLVILNLDVPNLLTRIDTSPTFCSNDEFETPTQVFNQAGNEPYNYPLLSRLRAEQGIHYLISANPSAGVVLNNLRQLNSNDDIYTTEVYQLVIESIPGAQFIQDFFGATKYNFNFFLKPSTVKNKANLSIGAILNGFTQNLSISCDKNQEGSSLIFRNGSVGLLCPDNSVSGTNQTFYMNPFIQKDMDAILNNYINTQWGSIIDYFVLSTDNSFMIVLHEFISIVRMQTSLQFAANVFLKDPSGRAVPFDQCITINEGSITEEILQIEIICFNSSYVLWSFPLNLTELAEIVQNPQSNPPDKIIDAEQYELSGSVASLYTSKNSQVMYLGDLYFSLNTIMIENYNDRGYLNIYNGAKSGRVIQPTLLWSSLSSEQFANCDLLIYKVTRLAQLIGVEQLCLFTIMECEGGMLWTSFTNITTGTSPTFNTAQSQPFNPNYPAGKVQLFWRNSTLFMFLLNQDVIQEYVSTNLYSFTSTNVYRLSSACDINADMSIFRAGNYLFVYCYNSTSDSTMSDTVLVYNTRVNIEDGSGYINPIQQLSFPDVDSPSNMILTSYYPPDDPDSVSLAISSTRSFISKYSFKSSAILSWEQFDQYKRDGYYDTNFTVLLGTQNILSSANTVVPFVIPLFSVIVNYLDWFYSNLAACTVVFLYLVLVNVLVYSGLSKQRRLEETNHVEANFIHQYKRIMHNDGLKSLLLDDTSSSPVATHAHSMASGHLSMGLTQANAGTEPRISTDQPFGNRVSNY